MSLTVLCPMPEFQATDALGAPLAGGLLYTAQPGTVAGPGQSFPKSTYTDATGQTANPNPVVLDAGGRAPVWLTGGYAMLLTDANGLTQYSADSVAGVGATGSTATIQVFGDATLAAFNANIQAANSALAPSYYEIFKTDVTANPVRITPAGGTVQGQPYIDLTTQGDSIRLVCSPSDNNWYRG